MNRRRGYVYEEKEGRRKTGRWVARLTFTDAAGRRRNVKRRAASKTAAKDALEEIIRRLDEQGEKAVEGDLIVFRELAALYRERRVFPAEYRGGRKVAGLRSPVPVSIYLDVLTAHFGARRVRDITHADVERFQRERLRTPTKHGAERAIASVNRELETLRAVLNFAKRQGWISRTPFEGGAPLISRASEAQRERILTREEEGRLLAACTGRRDHLRALLVCALDTGMRRGEMFKLRWLDVDLAAGVIRVRATTTKTMKPRTVGVTARLRAELQALKDASGADAGGLVFGLTNNCKKSFAGACKEAGVAGVRFHDLRHSAITRMIEAGMPPMQVMRISGHTQAATFARYVNVDEQAAQRAAGLLDALACAGEAVGASAYVH